MQTVMQLDQPVGIAPDQLRVIAGKLRRNLADAVDAFQPTLDRDPAGPCIIMDRVGTVNPRTADAYVRVGDVLGVLDALEQGAL